MTLIQTQNPLFSGFGVCATVCMLQRLKGYIYTFLLLFFEETLVGSGSCFGVETVTLSVSGGVSGRPSLG